MKKNICLSIFALIAGIVGASIRAFELSHAFEPDSGLQIPGEPVSLVMIAFAVAVLLLFAVAASLLRGKMKDDLKVFSDEKGAMSQMLVLASAILLFVAACVEYAFDRGGLPATRVIQILLAVFAAFSLMVRVWKPGRAYAFFALVPIFWCCYWLILVYRDRSIDPVVADYIYELFAVVASALFFYRTASYDFGIRNFRMTAFFGFSAIFLCTMTACGPILAKLLYDTAIANSETLLYFAACALYSVGGTIWFLKAEHRDFTARRMNTPRTATQRTE